MFISQDKQEFTDEVDKGSFLVSLSHLFSLSASQIQWKNAQTYIARSAVSFS